MEKEFRRLNEAGYKFKALEYSVSEIKFSNLFITLGLDIDRSKNFIKSEYLFIGNAEEIKETMPSDFKEKALDKKSDDFFNEIWKTQLNHFWLCIHPEAQTNIVMSIYAEFKGNNPLTLLKDEQDVVYAHKRVEEIHAVRFETELMKLSTQKEAIITGEFDHAMKILREKGEELIDRDWIIADIDGVMKGNSFNKN